MTHSRACTHGFSLLEVLVALSIMAFGLAALYQVSGGSVKAVHDDERYTYAIVLARSLLDRQQTLPTPGWSDTGTTEDGFHWRITSTPLEGQAAAPPPLHQVRIDVGWPDGRKERHVTLHTILPERPPAGEGP